MRTCAVAAWWYREVVTKLPGSRLRLNNFAAYTEPVVTYAIPESHDV